MNSLLLLTERNKQFPLRRHVSPPRFQRVEFYQNQVALQHKVARHRDVLSDYYSQFKRAKEKTRATKNRVDLLGSVRNDIEAYRNKSYSNEQTLNKENDKLKRKKF